MVERRKIREAAILSTLLSLVIVGGLVIGVSIFASGFLFSPRCADCNGGFLITLEVYSLRSGFTASNATTANSSFTFSLNNSGTPTYISSITLTRANLSSSSSIITNDWGTTPSVSSLVNMNWSCANLVTVTDPNNSVSTYVECAGTGNPPSALAVPQQSQTSFTFYPVTKGTESTQVLNGQTYSFTISFWNGQSISGSVTAQSQ